MGSMANERLQSHSYSLGVCGGMADKAGLFEQLFIDMERFFHTDDVAISCHIKQPDYAAQFLSWRCRLSRYANSASIFPRFFDMSHTTIATMPPP